MDGADPEIKGTFDAHANANISLEVEGRIVDKEVGPGVEVRTQGTAGEVCAEEAASHYAVRGYGEVGLTDDAEAGVEAPGDA